MCFLIPKKVISVTGKTAKLEDGHNVDLGNVKSVKKGDFLRVYGNIAIEKVRNKEAQAIRKFVDKLI